MRTNTERVTTAEIARLFETCAPQVHRVALGILADDDAADDVVGQVFARLLQAPQAVRPGKSYFTTAARNEAFHLSSRIHRWRGRLAFLYWNEFGYDADPETEIERARQSAILRQLIVHLPPRCREVLQLLVDEALTQREAAERLEITPKAVQKQVSRGRRVLLRMAADLDGGKSIGRLRESDGGGNRG